MLYKYIVMKIEYSEYHITWLSWSASSHWIQYAKEWD